MKALKLIGIGIGLCFSATASFAFDSHEHIHIGDHIKVPCVNFPTNNCENARLQEDMLGKFCPLALEAPSASEVPSLALTFGQIIALAGDFYGIPYHHSVMSFSIPVTPITDVDITPSDLYKEVNDQERSRFLDAFNSLYKDGNINEIKKIIATVNKVESSLQSGKAYDPTCDYEYATGALFCAHGVPAPADGLNGRYIKLAQSNTDHFGIYAIRTYIIGHAVALSCAKDVALEEPYTKEKWQEATRCIAMEGYAQHFLTDIFSTGHVRTPRVELIKSVTKSPVIVAGLLAKKMHDEDSLLGLQLNNEDQQSWFGYGDDELLSDKSKNHKDIVLEASQISLDEIFETLRYKRDYVISQYGALRKVPFLSQILPYYSDAQSDTKTHFALFVRNKAQSTLYRREDAKDPKSETYLKNWTSIGMLF